MALKERNHRITAKEKEQLTGRASALLLDGEVREFRFHADQVKELIDQEGAEVFVISKGETTENEETVVLTAETGDGKELPVILEVAFPCPPYCGDN